MKHSIWDTTIQVGELDEIMDFMFDIFTKMYNAELNAIDYENLQFDRPYINIIRLGIGMILEGKELPNILLKSEIFHFLLTQNQLTKIEVAELTLFEELLTELQKGLWDNIYWKANTLCSAQFLLKHNKILNDFQNMVGGKKVEPDSVSVAMIMYESE